MHVRPDMVIMIAKSTTTTLLAITGPTNTGKSMLAADVLRRVGAGDRKTINFPLKTGGKV